MLAMLRDMVSHNGHANAVLLGAIRHDGAAVADPELWDLLHHVLLANRVWLLSLLGLPFVLDDESRPSGSFDVLVQRYRETQNQQTAWLSTATESDLGRILQIDLIPGGRCPVAQAFVQVCSTHRAIDPSARSCCDGTAAHPRPRTSSCGWRVVRPRVDRFLARSRP